MVYVENIVKRFGDVVALNGISLTIEEGECVGFLGPNGAGKTTLVRALLGLVNLNKGNISIMNYKIPQEVKKAKRYIGVVPQETNLDIELNVYENLLIYGNLFNIPKEILKQRIHKLLEDMELLNKINENVEHLSGGMKRKLMLARSLINNPKLIILDEPTVGLDPEIRKHIWDKIINLKSEGKTIILTTHYLDEAQSLCDKVFIMDKGNIITSGNPETLIKQYLPEYVLEIHSKIQLPELKNTKKIEFENHTILFTDNPKEDKNLLHKKGIKNIKTRPTNLEDLFLFLTGKKLEENKNGMDSNI